MTSRSSIEQGEGKGIQSESDRAIPEESEQRESRMKRAAVQQMIERYFTQLTDGCGQTNCSNEDCATNVHFKYDGLSRNQRAATALMLLKNKARLCDPLQLPNKVAKSLPDPQPCTSTSEQEPGPSRSVSDKTPDTKGTGKSLSGGGAMDVSPSNSTESQPIHETTAAINAPIVSHLSESSLASIVEECESVKNWSLLIRTLGSVFNNPDSLVRSFIRVEPSTHMSKEELRAMEVDMDKDTDENETEMEDDAHEDSSHSNSFVEAQTADGSPHDTHVKLKEDEVSVDIDALRRAFTKLFAIPDSPFQSALTNALRSLARTVEMDLRYHQAYEKDPNYLNIFVIVFEILTMDTRQDLETCTPHIFKAAGLLPLAAQAKISRVWSKFSKERLKEMLGFFHQVITLRILSTQWSPSFAFNDDDGITGAAKVMKFVYYASILGGRLDPPALLEREKQSHKELEKSLQELLDGAMGREKDRSEPREDPLSKVLNINPLDCREPVLPWSDFINDLVSDGIRMEKDYTNYKSENNEKFSFLTHPFLLTTAKKNLGMYYDSKIRMVNERRVSLLQSLVNGAPSMPYLRIRIRRDHIIDDALVNLEMIAMDNPQDLKKQLYVEFEGEQGIDEGGVSKEFFQLVVEEIFNPDIGMFTLNDETGQFWFNSTSFENDSQFTLIGIVLGLAIYNNIILDIQFPMVVYRKLMGKLGTFEDLKDSHPVLAKSLQELLDYEGDIKETFMQTFCISYTNVFGTMISHNLKEDGDKIPVDKSNRQEFVDMYADFLLNKSLEKQFLAFNRGFQMVTDESPLKMFFQPTEVELLVCGSKNFDFRALEETTDYDGGFTLDSQVIKYFWEVVHDFSDDQKRKLLQFTTGSDRVPVGGLSNLKLVIARHGPDSDRLPTAHTCFNVLLLPDYSSKEKLQERLTKAILYAKGFGML